jgi:hypothetical protein
MREPLVQTFRPRLLHPLRITVDAIRSLSWTVSGNKISVKEIHFRPAKDVSPDEHENSLEISEFNFHATGLDLTIQSSNVALRLKVALNRRVNYSFRVVNTSLLE